jgi:hypothetical protein
VSAAAERRSRLASLEPSATDRPSGSGEPEQTANVPASIRALRPMTDGIVPIADAERAGRLEKAQRLMVENNVGRTDDRDLRRVRHSTRGLPLHH